jgi:hypothetical protein
MVVMVKKADGSVQPFDKAKVVKTCLKSGVNRGIAEEIAEKIEAKAYNGIETERILAMIFQHLREHRPIVGHFLDLRKGLSLLQSKPDFERFVQITLGENGYKVSSNQIIRGRCVEHEVDAIASKDDVTYFVEAKHHYNYHTPTGLDESRIARAVLEDVIEGRELGLNNLEIHRAMIVTNTKFSEHAKQYGECRGISLTGWSYPPRRGLQDLIEEKKIYPITCIKMLKKDARMKLLSNGIITLKQLVREEREELARKTALERKTLETIRDRAKSYLLLSP